MSKSEDSRYGIDVEPDVVVVAENIDGRPCVTGRYPPDDAGITALKQHIGTGRSHRRICIHSRGALALSLGLQLIPIARSEVMFVAPHALRGPVDAQGSSAVVTPEQRAQHLAVMARRML